MDIAILLFAGAIILIAVIFLTIIKNKYKPIQNEPQTAQVPEAIAQPGARRRALAAARSNRIRQRLEEDSSDEAENPPPISFTEGKIGTKKLAKLQAKAEKKAQRENEEKIREEKKKAQLIAEAEQKKLREQEEEKERKREEQERKLKEEKERQEYEEYLKMKEEFSVQEEGFDKTEENICPVQDFIDHIKNNKVVVLEDLACHFKLKTQDVINRINSLQEEGKLTGVIDDRGKFICISQDELESVAKFVKQRGRVSISELVENSNRLINLTQVESY